MDHSEVKHLPKVDHTPAELDTPAKLLLKAAELIETRGHCKGSAEGVDGGLCISGALTVADKHQISNERNVAFDRMSAALGGFPVQWNDAKERTKDEVVAKFRAVALGL